MTFEEKEKCSKLWEMASGDYIAPRCWTDSAGNELAKFFANIYRCSKAMLFVPRPVGSMPGYGWVATHVYNVLRTRYNLNKSLVFKGCAVQGVRNFRTSIMLECMN